MLITAEYFLEGYISLYINKAHDLFLWRQFLSENGTAEGCVDKLINLLKIHSLIERPPNLRLAQPKDGAIEKDILPPGQLRMKPGPHFKKARNPPFETGLNVELLNR
jgi:hypothetical protein